MSASPIDYFSIAVTTNTYAVTYVQDKLFYSGSKVDGIYSFFRNCDELHGEIRKPTGKKDEIIHIQGNYDINWLPLGNGASYYTVSI